MAKKFLKCTKCKYAFSLRQSEDIEKLTCPYCGRKNPKELFEELSETEFGNGYKLSLDEFKHVLKDASKSMIRAFFRKNSDIYSIEINKKGYVFRDNESVEQAVEVVHFAIQNDLVLQRKFYEIYNELYR